MRAWLFLLGGMIVWTVQFFSLYTIASVFGSSSFARILTVLITLVCLVADAALLMLAMRSIRGGGKDRAGRWIASLAALTAAISFIAVVWQGLPALLA